MARLSLVLLAALAACTPASTSTMPPPPQPAAAMPMPAGIGNGTYSTTIVAADLPAGASADMQSGLVGMWELVVDRPGHAVARYNGQQVVETQFEVQGNQVTFSNDTGQYACNTPGSYTWETTAAGLRFTKVNDPCDGRAVALTVHPWARRP
jgi:hypothetical protein